MSLVELYKAIARLFAEAPSTEYYRFQRDMLLVKLVASIHNTPKEAVIQVVTHVKIPSAAKQSKQPVPFK
jgi:hypothetical protein